MTDEKFYWVPANARICGVPDVTPSAEFDTREKAIEDACKYFGENTTLPYAMITLYRVAKPEPTMFSPNYEQILEFMNEWILDDYFDNIDNLEKCNYIDMSIPFSVSKTLSEEAEKEFNTFIGYWVNKYVIPDEETTIDLQDKNASIFIKRKEPDNK